MILKTLWIITLKLYLQRKTISFFSQFDTFTCRFGGRPVPPFRSGTAYLLMVEELQPPPKMNLVSQKSKQAQPCKNGPAMQAPRLRWLGG